jgi:hypothetical protein
MSAFLRVLALSATAAFLFCLFRIPSIALKHLIFNTGLAEIRRFVGSLDMGILFFVVFFISSIALFLKASLTRTVIVVAIPMLAILWLPLLFNLNQDVPNYIRNATIFSLDSTVSLGLTWLVLRSLEPSFNRWFGEPTSKATK